MKPQITLFASALVLGISVGGLPVRATPLRAAPVQLAQSSTPEQTYMTPQNANEIVVQIRDGEFFFRGTLQRSYGNYFTVNQDNVIVNYDRNIGEVVVANAVTGTVFYAYTFVEPGSEGSSTGNTAYGAEIPVTTITPLTVDQFEARIQDGEFLFDGVLTRTSGNTFIGTEGNVRVVYDLDAERIVVINVIAGNEYYNYAYEASSEGAL